MMQILNIVWVVLVMWLLIEVFQGRKHKNKELLSFYDNGKDAE